jgi:hypothetical protein
MNSPTADKNVRCVEDLSATKDTLDSTNERKKNQPSARTETTSTKGKLKVDFPVPMNKNIRYGKDPAANEDRLHTVSEPIRKNT